MCVTKKLKMLTRGHKRVDTIFTMFPKSKNVKPKKRTKILKLEAYSSSQIISFNNKRMFNLITRKDEDTDSSIERHS